MPPVSYRWLLPAVQIPIYLLLVWFGTPFRSAWLARAGVQNETDFVPVFVYGFPSLLEQLAFGINFPAATSGSFLAGLINTQTMAAYDLIRHVVTVALMPVQWYLLGRWVDRGGAIKARSRSGIARFTFGALLATLTGLGAILIIGEISSEHGWLVARVLSVAWLFGGALLVSARMGWWPGRGWFNERISPSDL